MKLNEALNTLQEAGFIAEAFNPNDERVTIWDEKNMKAFADYLKTGKRLTSIGKRNLEMLNSLIDKFNAAKWNRLTKAGLGDALAVIQQSYQDRIGKKKPAEEEPQIGNDWPDNETRAEDDGDYMGSYYKHYGLDDPCSDEEWAEAGKQWAQDMLDNGEFTEEDYDDAIEHYKYYSYDL